MRWKNGRRVLIVISMAIVVGGGGCGAESASPDVEDSSLLCAELSEDSVDYFYGDYISELLSEELWCARDAYDSCHYLMVPMYYAFYSRNDAYIQMFAEYMNRFVETVSDGDEEFDSLPGLTQNHHLYLASEYMCLCAQYGGDVSDDLFRYVYDRMCQYVEEHKANWASSAYEYEDMWDLFDGLLYGNGYGFGLSYDNVFTDNEMFPLAILCDLRYVQVQLGLESEYDTLNLEKAEEYSSLIMHNRVTEYDDGTWQFQVGVWTDYEDMKYAGIENPEEIDEESDYRVADIVSDSSHFARMPLFLRSFYRAASEEDESEYFEYLLDGLGETVIKKVLISPDETCDYYRMTNYMDGTNGVFRYSYEEDGVGYGQYQLSTTFLLGWWSFCGNEEIGEAYAYTAEAFPLDADGTDVYADPVTVREQNPLFISDTYKKYLCYLASKISVE